MAENQPLTQRPPADDDSSPVPPAEPSMWETVRGVVFVLGLAAALTISFTVLSVYEAAFSRVSYASSSDHFRSHSHAHAEQLADSQRERAAVAAEKPRAVTAAADNSRAMAA